MQSHGLFAAKPPEAGIASESKCEVKMKAPSFVLCFSTLGLFQLLIAGDINLQSKQTKI